MTNEEPPRTVFTTGDLHRSGSSNRIIKGRVASGELSRIRRGAFSSERPQDPVARHRELIWATHDRLGDRTVLSHDSAAVLLGLPVQNDRLALVRATRHRTGAGGGNTTAWVRISAAPWCDDDIVTVDGIQITSPARTAADLAREQSRDHAVITLDAALHLARRRTGSDADMRQQIAEHLRQARARSGYRAAVYALTLANGLAESPLETRSRLCFSDHGLPTPVLQLEILDEHGDFVGRVDFAWPDHDTIGEADGMVKYDLHRRLGERPIDVVMREKKRENRMQGMDWRVARWVDDDLDRPRALCARIASLMRL